MKKKTKDKTKKKYNEKQIERIKADSIRLAILYRSLYILKYKFEKYKNEVNKVYDKYYGGEKKQLESYDHRVIKTSNFFPLVQDIFKEMKITIPRIINPSDIFYFDIVNFDPNDKSHTESIKLMEKIVLNKNNLDKYNKIYYLRKIYPLVESFLKNKNNDDVTECYKITEYDRKGRVIHTCDELLAMMGIKGGYKGLRKNPKDEYDNYMKKGDILFVDTLPIIIADFLQSNPDFVVINLDTDDKELINTVKRFFDDDILKKIREEEEKNKNNKVVVKEPEIEETEDQKKLRELFAKKKKLEKTLQLYQDLLNQKKQNGESYKYILDFIDKLKKEIEKINEEIKELLRKINGENEDEEKKNEILPPIKGNINEIDLRMREIFTFYCSQHRAQASFPTFSQISYKVNHMNVSEFCKFCTDFKIPLEIDKLIEIYNKREPINENSEINYNEFLLILQKISILINENKKRKLKKKIDKIKKRMEGGNVSSDSEENEDDNGEGDILEKKQNELNYLSKLNFKSAYGELQKYLEIDKPKKYRDKMKGFLIRYHDDMEKIEKYDLLTKEEILEIQEKAEKLKKIREDNEKEKENIKEKKKKELYEIKKVGFIEKNKRLLKRIKEKEEKKTYMMLRNLKKKEKEDNKCIININKPTEELKLNLERDEKELLNIDEDEENSDEDILEKYGVPKNKKIIKKEVKEVNALNDKINLDDKEKENIPDNTINNNENKQNNENNLDNNNNVNNKTSTNDILSSVNSSNTNASADIMTLKQNLKPKKKENIYFFSNNKKEEINDEETEDKQKDEKETDNIEEKEKEKEIDKKGKENKEKIIDLSKEIKKKQEKNEKKEEKVNKNINSINVINNKNNKEEKVNEDLIKVEGIYLTEPDINKFRKRTLPAKKISPINSLNKKIIPLRNRIGSNSLEARKKIKKELLTKVNKNIYKEQDNLNNSFKKDNYKLNNNINKSNDIINQNKSYDKITIKTNNNNSLKDIQINNYKNKGKKNKSILLNSIKKYNKESNFNKGNNNIPVIKLPSVNVNNISSSPNHQNTIPNNNNVIVLPEINSPKNSLENINSNIIVLPEINSSKNPIDNITNKEPSTITENKRYLLFQKNYNKDSKINKLIKSNNNIIKLSDEKEKPINRRGNSLVNNNKELKKEGSLNKKK